MTTSEKQDTLDVLYDLMTIMHYYHKGEVPKHEDACEAPDICGHCLAMRKAKKLVVSIQTQE